MTKAISIVVAAFLVVLALSVWQELTTDTQQRLAMLWTLLVRLVARAVEWLVAALGR